MGLLGSDPPVSTRFVPAPQPPSSCPEIQLVRLLAIHENPTRGRPAVDAVLVQLLQLPLAA
jgi:hypothetical protein